MSEWNHSEIWKDIPQFAGVYQASSLGRIRRLAGYGCRETRVLKPKVLGGVRCGYHVVKIFTRGKHKTWRIHRLVAYAFHGMKVDNFVVHHIDSVRTNNRLDNLELVTGRINTQLARSQRKAERDLLPIAHDLHWEY